MKSYYFRILVLLVALFVGSGTYAQDVITTYAGIGQTPGYTGDFGQATAAQLNSPSDIIVDATGNLFIADFANNVIRKVDTFGIITTIAGTGFGAGTSGACSCYGGEGGPATAALLNGPYGLAMDASGNIIFADGYNHLVRKINMTTGIISKFAGNGVAGFFGDGGPATATNAQLNNPVGIVIDKAGNVYIADDHNNRIRKVDVAGNLSTIAGNTTVGYSGDGGPATAALMSLPIGLAIDTAGNLYVAEETNNVIRKIDKSGMISTFAGTGSGGYSGDGSAATSAKIDSAQRIVFDDSDNLYISDGGNNVVRKVNKAGIITTFAGNGVGAGTTSGTYSGDDSSALNAGLYIPQGVAFDALHRVYISDRGNSVIRRIGPPAPVVVVDHTGVNSLTGSRSSDLSIYPNPVMSGVFTTKLTSNMTEAAQVIVTNILGQKIYSHATVTNTPLTISLQVPPGVYFLSATTTHGQWNKQVTIGK